MKRLKKDLLSDNQLSTSSFTDNSTSTTSLFTDNSTRSTSSSASNFTTRSNDTYIYGISKIAVLTIGACVFFLYNKKSSGFE